MWEKLTSHHLDTRELLWLLFGLVGQIMFTGRFIVQWIASERAKRSVVTRSFWLFSIIGSSMLSVYAIYRRDPVFILGQVPGIAIYGRNLIIMRNAEKQARAARAAAEATEARAGLLGTKEGNAAGAADKETEQAVRPQAET